MRILPTLILLALLACFAFPATAATLDTDDLDAIQTMVDKAVLKRMAPLKRELAEINAGDVSVHDVASGIGYFLGIAGLLAYARSRKTG